MGIVSTSTPTDARSRSLLRMPPHPRQPAVSDCLAGGGGTADVGVMAAAANRTERHDVYLPSNGHVTGIAAGSPSQLISHRMPNGSRTTP
jgi:hypothetical protein